jgi:serine/threonine protein kinase
MLALCCFMLLTLFLQAGEIGHGHIGTVYVALWHGKAVAVKKLHHYNSRPKELTAKLHASICHHNNVHPGVALYGIVDEPQMCAMVMPLMQHGSLPHACKLYRADPQLVSCRFALNTWCIAYLVHCILGAFHS